MFGVVFSGRVKTGYANNNLIQNAFKITTAQIDTISDLIKGNYKSLVESLKYFWIVEDTVLNRNFFIKNLENYIEYKDSQYTAKLLER